MRINTENKSIDIETRDINFIIDSYAVSYKFSTKNMPLERVVIPMFSTAHTRYGDIPIEFVPDVSAYAQELAEDGKAVKEVTPAEADEIAVQDAKVQQLKKEVLAPANPVVIAPVRAPKLPPGPIIPPGEGGLNLAPRDPADLRKTRADLAPEKDIDESKQKNIVVSKDESGNKRLV